jgi:hypothetical protein
MREIINALRKEIEKKEPNRRIFRTSQKLEKYLRSEIKRKDRQINIARFINLIRALVITAKIRDTRARILINSEYLNNFVFPDFVEKA